MRPIRLTRADEEYFRNKYNYHALAVDVGGLYQVCLDVAEEMRHRVTQQMGHKAHGMVPAQVPWGYLQ